MMAELISITYEQARADFLKAEMEIAQNRMKFWQTKIKKAKNAIAEMEAHDNASNAGWEYNFYKDALDALKAAKDINVPTNQPKWISVEDRLPEVSDLVLVIANGKPKKNVELINACLIASFWGDEGWIADGFDGWDKLKVTHWMPLPEPPKEDV